MNKRILISLSVIGVVAAVIVGGTIAFFSDTETSTGNTFTAGAIDLTVDNQSYVTGPDGNLVYSNETSWILDDLTGQLFFNFSDLKPGDIGEDTISLHVDSNDAYLCVAMQITDNSDQSCTEPELEVDVNCPADGGELAENIEFAFWADDGDNVYEDGEYLFLEGKISDVFQGQIALADSQYNVWTETGGALEAGTTKYIGKAWCFGDLQMIELNQGTSDPLQRSGFATCDGVAVNNAPQTDRVMGDIQFYAVQARNNPNFTCAGDYNPSYPGTRTLVLENKNTNWKVLDDTTKGTLTYNTTGEKFTGTFEATGLTVSTSYTLVYYADKDPRFQEWGGNNPGAVIATFSSDTSGDIVSGNIDVELGMDLPSSPDWNINPIPNYCDKNNTHDDYNTCAGAKIWLVLTDDLTSGPNLPLVSWNPSDYLFETDLINYNDISI